MRWTLVLTFHPDTPHTDRVTLLSQIRALAGHGIVRVRGGLHLPGSVGPGHATVHLLLQHRRPPSADSALAALLTNPDAGIASAVAYPLQTLYGSDTDPDTPGAGAVRRTLFLAVRPDTRPAAVTALEVLLAGLPRRIDSIGAWRLSWVGPATGRDAPGAPAWTHALDHTVDSPQELDLSSDYMRHPYHVTCVDGLFDPTDPRCVVQLFSHTYLEDGT